VNGIVYSAEKSEGSNIASRKVIACPQNAVKLSVGNLSRSLSFDDIFDQNDV
jgi:hypothetical protein